jgi:hypothetical protein
VSLGVQSIVQWLVQGADSKLKNSYQSSQETQKNYQTNKYPDAVGHCAFSCFYNVSVICSMFS